MSEKEHWIYDSVFYGTFSIVARKTPSSRARSHIKVCDLDRNIFGQASCATQMLPFIKCKRRKSFSLITIAISKGIARGY